MYIYNIHTLFQPDATSSLGRTRAPPCRCRTGRRRHLHRCSSSILPLALALQSSVTYACYTPTYDPSLTVSLWHRPPPPPSPPPGQQQHPPASTFSAVQRHVRPLHSQVGELTTPNPSPCRCRFRTGRLLRLHQSSSPILLRLPALALGPVQCHVCLLHP